MTSKRVKSFTNANLMRSKDSSEYNALECNLNELPFLDWDVEQEYAWWP